MEVHLKGQPGPVTLESVEQDDEQAVIGTTPTGKRFVALRSQIGELPDRHPYRIYLRNGTGYRVIDPAFEELEGWLLLEYALPQHEHPDDEQTVEVMLEGGHPMDIHRNDIRSLLSAAPADEAARNGDLAATEALTE